MTGDIERRINLVSAKLKRERGIPLDADELKAVDDLLSAVALAHETSDPAVLAKAAGLARAKAGKPVDPRSQAAQIREVINAIGEVCARTGKKLRAASDDLDNGIRDFVDPRAPWRGKDTARKPLSAEQIRRIWREHASDADRRLVKTVR